MPSTTEGLLLVIGVIFMMIAFIGGGFELSAAKIPPVGKKGRIGSAILGALFLVLALRSIAFRDAKPDDKHTVFDTAATTSAAVTTTTAAAAPPTPAQPPPRTPIDNLYKAWEERNLEAYLDQWDRMGRQWIGEKHRTLPEIAQKRREDFERYRRVQVIGYQVDIDPTATDPVIARVTYSMRFQRPDGTWINEIDRRETYKLKFLKEQNRWVILENFDYFIR